MFANLCNTLTNGKPLTVGVEVYVEFDTKLIYDLVFYKKTSEAAWMNPVWDPWVIIFTSLFIINILCPWLHCLGSSTDTETLLASRRSTQCVDEGFFYLHMKSFQRALKLQGSIAFCVMLCCMKFVKAAAEGQQIRGEQMYTRPCHINSFCACAENLPLGCCYF